MIGLDTNILIRFIVQDDPEQSSRANAFIEAYITLDTPGYINPIVLCETVWVLKRAYNYDKMVIMQVLRQILNTRELVVEQSDAARQALEAYSAGEADFSDYYLGAMNRMAGCQRTVTFDRAAGQHPDFDLLK
jgi:predicted nucleic-acid-binding protein